MPVKKMRGCTRAFAPGCTIRRSTSLQAPGGSLKVRQHFHVVRTKTSLWSEKWPSSKRYDERKETAEMVARHVHLKTGCYLEEDTMVNEALFWTRNTQNTRRLSWNDLILRWFLKKKNDPAATKERFWAVWNVGWLWPKNTDCTKRCVSLCKLL